MVSRIGENVVKNVKDKIMGVVRKEIGLWEIEVFDVI